MKINAPGIRPEIVAAITASVCAMMGTGNIAVKITRTSEVWKFAGRQALAAARRQG
ncbi:MAG: hypothetical protein LLG02_06105 [Pelosinus sp.]|nr:hypothetical protein [Pelosinus sp.]